jgi:hypothetical protein
MDQFIALSQFWPLPSLVIGEDLAEAADRIGTLRRAKVQYSSGSVMVWPCIVGVTPPWPPFFTLAPACSSAAFTAASSFAAAARVCKTWGNKEEFS